MAKKKSYLTVGDQFCGAGGSSQGVRRYANRTGLGNGLVVTDAWNHSKLALETHQTNFPDARHYCTDISACNPKDYHTTDILITSPECTNHSVAKGKKQVKAQLDLYAKGKQDALAERSRATMWDVVRFTEFHKYNIVITENVVDAAAWVLYDAWIKAMHSLGYYHERKFFNSMHAWPCPQSRDRMYVVFWKRGNKKPDLDLRPLAPCRQCGNVRAIQRFKPGASVKAKFGTQYTYVCPSCAKDVLPFYFAAINAIDWTIPAERIGDRRKPLEPRTMQRIAFGLEKYGNRPLSISMLDGQPRTNLESRVKDATDAPIQTLHSVGTAAFASPFTVETKYSHAGEKRARGAVEPLPGQTGQASVGVTLPFTVDTSFSQGSGNYAFGPDAPMNTQATTQSKGVVVPPALMVGTDYFTEHVRPVDGVLPAQTSANKMGVAMTMSLNYPDQHPKQVSDALDTVTANRPLSLVSPFLLNMRGTSPDKIPHSTEGMNEALGTMTAGGPHHGVVTPFMANMRGTEDAHIRSGANGLDQPMGTVSAGGFHHALLTGKALAFLASYYKSPTMAGMDEPMGTLPALDKHTLVAGQGGMPAIEDLYFRMLKASEVKTGMAFDPDYVVLGNQREQVRQLGNAVTPPVMEMLIERCVESLM